MAFFTEKKIIKSVWNHKRPIIALRSKVILIKRNKTSHIALPGFKLNYKAIVIKQYGTGIQTDIEQWNRTESPEVKQHIHGEHLIYDQGGKNTRVKGQFLHQMM